MTLNRKMLADIDRIREEIKSSMVVPIDLEDSKIVETSLDFFLKTLEKGKSERKDPPDSETTEKDDPDENRTRLLAIILQKTRNAKELDTLLAGGSIEKIADDYLTAVKKKPSAGT